MIEAIKNGDVNAFEAAYVQYRGKLYAYFLKKTNGEEDAKDLLQITFSKFWQYRNSLSAEYLLEQHLFHIARTVFIDFLRKENKLQKVRTTAKLLGSEKVSEEYMNEFDLRTRLQTVLSQMPVQRKRVFELHKIEGYSYKEVAEILSISVKAVDNNLAKALKYLRNAELLLLLLLLNLVH